MTELDAFLAMLERSHCGFGLRYDYNPTGTSVQVEHPHEGDDGFHITDWQFDEAGKLVEVSHYEGVVG